MKNNLLTKEDIILICLDDPEKLTVDIQNNKILRSDEMRELVCLFNDARNAYWYAEEIDNEIPHILTRKVACLEPFWAYQYALRIDKKPRKDTRTAACALEWLAFRYAENVDKKPRNETRRASKGTWSIDYRKWEEEYWKSFQIKYHYK